MAVRKRGAKWAVQVYEPAKGEKVWVGTFPTRREAKEAEAKARLRRRRSVETCDGFAGRWMDDYPRTRESTNITYRQQIRRFTEDFRGRRLDSVTKLEARQWAREHPTSFPAVRAMFSDAARDELVAANPFLGLRFAQTRGRRDLDVLAVAEVHRIADLASGMWGPQFTAFFLTAAFVGMRPGELYALRWECVHLDRDEVDVVQSYSSTSRQFTTPKNHLTRTVALTPPAKRALLDLPRRDELVFQTVTGRPMSGRVLHHYWNPLRVAAGYPGMSFYLATRHFCASYLLNDLELPAQDVALQLGHQNVRLVFDLYGHPSERLARERIKRAFGADVVPLRRVRGHLGGEQA